MNFFLLGLCHLACFLLFRLKEDGKGGWKGVRQTKEHAAVFEEVPPEHQPSSEALTQHRKERKRRVAASTGQLGQDAATTQKVDRLLVGSSSCVFYRLAGAFGGAFGATSGSNLRQIIFIFQNKIQMF